MTKGERRQSYKYILLASTLFLFFGVMIGNLMANNGGCLPEKIPIIQESRQEAYDRCSRKRDDVCGENNSFGYSAWFDYGSDKTIRECDISCVYEVLDDGSLGECTKEAKKYNAC